MPNSLWSHGLQPIRLLYPWDFLGKNTGVGCHFLLQGIFLTQGWNAYLLHLLHWQVDSIPLRHLGSPCTRLFDPELCVWGSHSAPRNCWLGVLISQLKTLKPRKSMVITGTNLWAWRPAFKSWIAPHWLSVLGKSPAPCGLYFLIWKTEVLGHLISRISSSFNFLDLMCNLAKDRGWITRL